MCVSAVLVGLPASGQAALKTKFTDAELLGIVQSEGYAAEISKDGLVIIKIDGSKYLLYNLEDGDLQFFTASAISTYRFPTSMNGIARSDFQEPILIPRATPVSSAISSRMPVSLQIM